MNHQEIFNTVATHLFTQGHPAVKGDGCRYRVTNSNDRCAVGILIPDDCYSPLMEEQTVEALRNDYGDKLPQDIFSPTKVHLLQSLQLVHDHDTTNKMDIEKKYIAPYWSSTENMRRALMIVAKNYDLSPEILATLSFSDR